MAFSVTWDETDPDGATVDANQIDEKIRADKVAVRERITSITGVSSGNFNVDPFAPTKYGPNVTIDTKNLYVTTVHNYGTWTTGVSSVDWKNGNRQKIALGATGWSPTFVSGVEGADFTLHITWNSPGYTFTLPSNVKWTNNTVPNFTLSGKSFVYFYFNGTNWEAALCNTGVP